jgi:hypothetical protein
MATTKMAEIHVNVTSDASGNQIVFHNSGQVPLAIGAGQTITPAVKTAGNPNGVVHGQVTGTGVLIHNPA